MWCNQLVVRLAALLLHLPGIYIGADLHHQAVQRLVHQHLGLDPVRSAGASSSDTAAGSLQAASSSAASHQEASCRQPAPGDLAERTAVVQGPLFVLLEPGVQSNNRHAILLVCRCTKLPLADLVLMPLLYAWCAAAGGSGKRQQWFRCGWRWW